MNNTNSRKSLMIINNIKKQNKTKQNQKFQKTVKPIIAK